MREAFFVPAAAAVVLGALLAGVPAAAQTPTAVILGLADRCEARGGGIVGLSVVDLRDGAVLASRREQELFSPASNQKLVTTAFALSRLGGSFQFTTAVYRLGNSIAVLGNGDPLLGDPFVAQQSGGSIYDELDRWAACVRSSMGSDIAGDLIVCTRDGGAYRPSGWPANQRRHWYQAPVAALNFHNNCIDVTFALTAEGIAPQVSPTSRWISIVNRLRAGKSHRWTAVTSDGDAVVTLSGTVSSATSQPVSVAIDDPPMFLGRIFADRLARAGVHLGGQVRSVRASQLDWSSAVELARTDTPLAAALTRANKRSLNMAAESILLYAGDGTWEGTCSMLPGVLESSMGIPAGQVQPADGSGLSPTNRVSPAAVTTILAALVRGPYRQMVLSSMAISGVDGTMEDRLAEPAYRGRILGKTGYIAGVSCLSGYVLDRSGDPAVAFSVLVNRCRGSAHAKALQDDLAKALVDWLDS